MKFREKIKWNIATVAYVVLCTVFLLWLEYFSDVEIVHGVGEKLKVPKNSIK